MITWAPDATVAPSARTMRLIAILLILFVAASIMVLLPRQQSVVTVGDLGSAVAHQCLSDGDPGSANWLACVHTQSGEVVTAAHESGRDLWSPEPNRNGLRVVNWEQAPALVESAAHDVAEVR